MFNVTCLDKHGDTIQTLTQWDINQVIYIEDSGFDTPPQFHFCNKNSEKAFVVQSTMDDNGVLAVIIPNQLIVEPYTIFMYVYIKDEESGKTVETIQIPVRSRPQPADFVFEGNTEVIQITEFAEELKALINQASASESDRVQRETIRIQNENKRITAENSRIQAENTRSTAETSRINKENERITSENARIAAENVRGTAETNRINAEINREKSENIRTTNETTRISNEESRVENENDRVYAENIRISNEEARLEAEEIRISSEATRKNNEITRQMQESDRQTTTATAITNADQATTRANRAAEACENIVAGVGFIPITDKGATNGVAPLDENGKVPVEHLPDDLAVTDAESVNGVKIFKDISQLGITSYYIPDIVRAMPEFSMFFCYSNSTTGELYKAGNDLPSSTGSLEIIKLTGGRTRILYATGTSAKKEKVYYCDLDETNWKINGWNKMGEGDFLPISGLVTAQDGITFKAFNNGFSNIRKNHSETADYGMVIKDTDIDGNTISIVLCGKQQTARLRDKSGAYKDLIHTGNIKDLVKFVQYLGEIKDVEMLNNPNYTDSPYEGVISDTIAEQIGLPKKFWHIKYYKHSHNNGYGYQEARPLNDSTATPLQRSASGTAWKEWTTKFLPSDGSVAMTGDLKLQKADNGRGVILKSHSDTYDYGTFVRDVAKGGAYSQLVLRANKNTFTYEENDGNTTTKHDIIHSGNYADYNQFSKGITLTDASGDEGGEIRFAKPQTNTSFGSVIGQDVYREQMRMYATHDSKTKVFAVDFRNLKEGDNEALHTGNSAKVIVSDQPLTEDGSIRVW